MILPKIHLTHRESALLRHAWWARTARQELANAAQEAEPGFQRRWLQAARESARVARKAYQEALQAA